MKALAIFKKVLIAFALCATVTCQAIQYRIQDIGLSAATSSKITAINDRGDVAGICVIYFGVKQGFIWTQEEGLIILDKPAGTFDISSINNHGQVVGTFIQREGFFFPTETIRPFLWSKENGFQDLGMVNSENTWGCSINDEGSVFLKTASGGVYVWENGKVEKIVSNVVNHNEMIQVVMKGHHLAYLQNDDTENPGIKALLLNLQSSEKKTFPYAFQKTPSLSGLNGIGQVTGFFYDDNNFTGFISDTHGETMTYKDFVPMDINDKGIAIGINLSESKELTGAILLHGETTSLEIKPLITSSEQGLPFEKISRLDGINQNGWITGTALRNGSKHAVLLIPIEESLEQR